MKKWLTLILVLALGFPVQAEEPKELYAQSAVLMDADSGRVLFEKNGFDVKAMASTTKIMTCILALENADENAVITFSENAAKQPKVHLGATVGETFYLKDLLHSLMLESHNDSAVAIAEAVSGDVKTFAKKMNEKAKEIGCNSTYFITPNGLDASDEQGKHSTTAIDLAKIMSYCIMDSPKKDRFLEITQAAQYSFSNIEGKRSYSCTNHNSFLSMMDEAISGKTGFTADAGYCYVGAVESEGRTFVVSLLACGWPNNKNYKWADMKKIVTYGMENYTYKDVQITPELQKIEVLNGIPASGELFENAVIEPRIVNFGETISVLMNQSEQTEVQIEQKEVLTAPIESGEEVGEITYWLDGKIIARYPAITGVNVRERDFAWTFSKILEMYALQ